MKINKDELVKCLKIASKVVASGKTNFAILNTVLIDGPGQKIVATDLETAMLYPVEIIDWEKTAPKDPEKAALVEAQKKPDQEMFEGLKKPQLVELAKDYGIEVPGKGTVPAIKKAILSALQAAADEDKTEVEMVTIEEKYCMGAKDLLKIVNSLEEETVEITLSDDTDGLFDSPMVRVGNHFQGVATLSADEFPAVEREMSDEKTTATISKENLVKLFPATTKEDSGFKLSVIYFDSEENKAVATDGHRLHLVNAEAEESFCLPVSAGKLVASLAKDDINLDVDDGNIFVNIGGAQFIIRAQEVNYPDYKVVIPNNSKHTVIVTKANVEKALNQAMILTSDSYRGAKLTFNGGIDIQVVNPDKGNYQRAEIELTEGKVDPSVEVGLNLGYVIDVMKTAGEKTEVSVGLTDEKSPLVFEYEDFFGLVMPMRI